MTAPAVSGAQNYDQLCLSARNEEKRLLELKKRRSYSKVQYPRNVIPSPTSVMRKNDHKFSSSNSRDQNNRFAIRCYVCNKPGHVAKDCRSRPSESRGQGSARGQQDNGLHRVQSKTDSQGSSSTSSLVDALYSSDDTDGVNLVRITDKGSCSRCVTVEVQGVSVDGIIDTGADISIMGGEVFKKVAAVAKLRKSHLKKADKTPHNYDQTPFSLDGRMDLDVTFEGVTMCTPIYIKSDAHEQLLLSEGVCRQLNIVRYHTNTRQRSRPVKQRQVNLDPAKCDTQDDVEQQPVGDAAVVPTVTVSLIDSVRVLPGQSTIATVKVDRATQEGKWWLLESGTEEPDNWVGVQLEDTLLDPKNRDHAEVRLTNLSGLTQKLAAGTVLGTAQEVEVVEPSQPSHEEEYATVRLVCDDEEARVDKLMHLVEMPEELEEEDVTLFRQFLARHHEAFSLEPGERGETDLVQMEIDTLDAAPRRQPVRRMPYSVRQEVARQLQDMQAAGVITKSSSAWASPVVLVRKKDGSHRFCVDYRQLNAVTKPDRYPLPRIDDLLDQLGKSCYFSTLDLASGYWQIRVHPSSTEKTAFITPQGLFEFKVMPFGLTNAPSVFQRLMHRVLQSLNPAEGPDFVSVYIDDVLVFSPTLSDHLQHLQLVIERLHEVGLKLQPVKCHFIRKEVEYLGHLVTPTGLKTNPRLVEAVNGFPTPDGIKGVRQFLGLASYYRKFIPQFAKVAQPLHHLTRNQVIFSWDESCENAFKTLKQKLINSPVLAYPSFTRPFVLETDACLEGLGAVLSQPQDDGHLHPIAYASRALAPSEKNYGITELETLAVVWALSHFHFYLYNQTVTLYTDHSAVKDILGSSQLSGKHARWWMKVYNQGIKELKIIHRAGKLNIRADSLSRNPLESDKTPEELDIHVGSVDTSRDITTLLQEEATDSTTMPIPLGRQQRQDPELKEIMLFVETGELPKDDSRARKLSLQGSMFVIVDSVLYKVDPKKRSKQVVVPQHLRRQLTDEYHRGKMAGHFSVDRVFKTMASKWWWNGMYKDIDNIVSGCPECAIVSGGGKVRTPPLCPIPVQRPFQIMG